MTEKQIEYKLSKIDEDTGSPEVLVVGQDGKIRIHVDGWLSTTQLTWLALHLVGQEMELQQRLAEEILDQ